MAGKLNKRRSGLKKNAFYVSGTAVRNGIDPAFVDIADHETHSWVPSGEVWLDERLPIKEARELLDSVAVPREVEKLAEIEREMVANGWIVKTSKAQQGKTLSVILDLSDMKDWHKHLQGAVKRVLPEAETRGNKPHVTLAYANRVDADRMQEAGNKLREELKGATTRFNLGPVIDFTNRSGQGVIALKASSKDLTQLHRDLRGVLKPYGAKFTFPQFKGHATLAYTPKGLTDEERGRLYAAIKIKPAVVTRSEYNTDITQKVQGQGWKKLAALLNAKVAADLPRLSPPRIGERVPVQLEKGRNINLIATGFQPGTKNPADGDPWDVLVLDKKERDTADKVRATVVGRLWDHTGNHKYVGLMKQRDLNDKDEKLLQSYQLARTVWKGPMRIEVPGIQNVYMRLGKTYPEREKTAFFEEYAKHTALNLGQAARDVRYLGNHPQADGVIDSMKHRIPSLLNNLMYAALPPQLHHSADELADLKKAPMQDWFMHGYKPWENPDPAAPRRALDPDEALPKQAMPFSGSDPNAQAFEERARGLTAYLKTMGVDIGEVGALGPPQGAAANPRSNLDWLMRPGPAQSKAMDMVLKLRRRSTGVGLEGPGGKYHRPGEWHAEHGGPLSGTSAANPQAFSGPDDQMKAGADRAAAIFFPQEPERPIGMTTVGEMLKDAGMVANALRKTRLLARRPMSTQKAVTLGGMGLAAVSPLPGAVIPAAAYVGQKIPGVKGYLRAVEARYRLKSMQEIRARSGNAPLEHQIQQSDPTAMFFPPTMKYGEDAEHIQVSALIKGADYLKSLMAKLDVPVQPTANPRAPIHAVKEQFPRTELASRDFGLTPVRASMSVQ